MDISLTSTHERGSHSAEADATFGERSLAGGYTTRTDELRQLAFTAHKLGLVAKASSMLSKNW